MAGSDRSQIGRLFGVSAVLAAVLLANSCTEFARTNPFDPAVPVTLTLSGPDSTFAEFDTVRFTVATDPTYDYDPPDWQLSGGLFRLDDNGTYQVRAIELYGRQPAQVTVAVKIGPRTATKTVNITFRPATLRVRNCADGSRSVTFNALGPQSGVLLCTTVLDARGGMISQDADVPPYTLVTRVLDTNVVKGVFSRGLEAVGNGTSFVVYTYGPVSDTVTVNVQQKAHSLTLSPSSMCNGTVSLGQTVQFTIGAPGFDANNTALVDQSIAQREGQDMRWRIAWYDSTMAPPVNITPLGQMTATSPGWVWITANSSTNPGIMPVGCTFEVK